MILVCSATHPLYLVFVEIGWPKGYTQGNQPVILPIVNIDKNLGKLERLRLKLCCGLRVAYLGSRNGGML
jgi:hypothetical protein